MDLSQQEQAYAAMRANREALLLEENQELRQRALDAEARILSVQSFRAEGGRFSATVVGEAAALQADLLVQWFEDAGGRNYVQSRCIKGPHEYVFTVQRADGKTPSEMKEEAETETKRLRAALGALRAEVLSLHRRKVKSPTGLIETRMRELGLWEAIS